jgi:hypothetical protein
MNKWSTASIVGCLLVATSAAAQDAPWKRHTIDSSSRGADGVRLADVNGDGRLDIVTGWEEGGAIRVCVHPGPAAVRKNWSSVQVGAVKSPEDAVLVDLDGDGGMDVVSSTEGNERTVFVHWSPRERARILDPAAWKTSAIAATKGKTAWMFALPMDIDGKHGIDLVVGSKNPRGQVSWLESPADPRQADAWKLHPLCDAGWIMSLIAKDMDGDGDDDALFSDRKGERSGIKWLENPGKTSDGLRAAWREHPIAAAKQEVMFLDVADLDGDGLEDIVAPVKPDTLLAVQRLNKDGRQWKAFEHRWPDRGIAGGPKGGCAADLNGDGRIDFALTCEGAAGEKSGVWWLEWSPFAEQPKPAKPILHNVGGAPGVKYDLVRAIDLDGDGDLDLLTCEESDNLGVIWYENPLR